MWACFHHCSGNVKQEAKIPRNSSGTYSLPIAAFVPGGLIKSADHNSNYSDIATALTQSLATTGVSTMTGPINAAAGLVGSPSYTFNGASKTGFYLAGANQIGWTANGVQGATFNSDTTVTWASGATFGGPVSGKGAVPIGAVADFAGSAAPSGWLLCFGQLVSTTTYAALFAVLSTTYGSGGGTFGIPDYRGRATFGQDNMGGSAASRITVAGGNFDGTVLGGTGGLQNHPLTLAETPTGITSSGSFTSTVTSFLSAPIGGFTAFTTPGTGTVFQAFNSGATVNFTTVTGPLNVTSFNTSGSAHTILNPAIITNKIIYAGV